ncbi:pyruvate, water dikinase regulatory protein [Alicyclobacillus sp. SO9]|uniref:pyruvate, water dikinase regulatory protein n=1 Tax=Alicyclobacillus sp. SO9 TaxID=2665646 RepID=UPI0018E8956A|nr:pyruvate, water dikinase regulatory protein [Alicyclobacillus sp. SO9]QQE77328.1 kinase/pyrophosphorylase [Alicyclobacillus sp. SO9]
MTDETPIVYVVSDSVGETAEFVVRAAASQFDGGHCDLRRVSHVQDKGVIDEVVQSAVDDNAMIAFTIVLPSLREYLMTEAQTAGLQTVDIMGPMLDAFESVVGEPPIRQAGLVHQLDEDYFRRVDAVEFAVKYDDGRDARGLERADIILVGVSRTSKTPLSMYLAHRGIRVANVPLVPEVTPPEELFHLGNPGKIIGLTIRADKLNAIRQERLKSLGLTASANYATLERILMELDYSESIMKKLKCHTIDVSDKAVEETAGLIYEYIKRKGQGA